MFERMYVQIYRIFVCMHVCIYTRHVFRDLAPLRYVCMHVERAYNKYIGHLCVCMCVYTVYIYTRHVFGELAPLRYVCMHV